MPLKVFIERMKSQRDEALQASNPRSDQQSLIRLLGRLDHVPGLAERLLDADYTIGYKQIDELMLLLDLLRREEATVRVLEDDTFPGTIIGRLQSAIFDTGASSYVAFFYFLYSIFKIFLIKTYMLI